MTGVLNMEDQAFQGMLVEYKALRDEIIGNQRDSVQILSFLSAFVTVIFGYSITSKEWWPFLVLEFVTIPVLMFQIQRLIVTYRIATHIRHNIEQPETGLTWETFMEEQRNHRTYVELCCRYRYAVCLPILMAQIAALIGIFAFWQGQYWVICTISIVSAIVFIIEAHMIFFANLKGNDKKL